MKRAVKSPWACASHGLETARGCFPCRRAAIWRDAWTAGAVAVVDRIHGAYGSRTVAKITERPLAPWLKEPALTDEDRKTLASMNDDLEQIARQTLLEGLE